MPRIHRGTDQGGERGRALRQEAAGHFVGIERSPWCWERSGKTEKQWLVVGVVM